MSFAGIEPKKAKAESIENYISKLSPMIAELPGCSDKISGSISGLFSKVKDMVNGKEKNDKTEQSVEDQVKFNAGDYVPVVDEESVEMLKDVKKTTESTEKKVSSLETNNTCLNAIGKAVAKILVQDITESVVNWIQTGDFGDPLFIQNPSQYFEDIAKNEILGFGQEISDPTLYPFGKAFMQIKANSFKNKFANNAKYSLNTLMEDRYPGFTSENFYADFSQGGWGAWNAMVQNPANNPLGFALMASEELEKRIEEKTSLAKDSLQQSGGYLGVERCANPEGVSKEEDDNYRNGVEGARKCKSWETVTPGRLIGDELTNTFMKKDNALMDVETLNDAVAAILDAVLDKFVSSFQEEGLADLNIDSYYETYDFEGFGSSQSDQDYTDAQINASTWLKQHPDFDIRTDLNQALIDEQRIYSDKLETQNKELYSTVEKSTENPLGNYGLVPTIYQLDYCIPGPHTGWKEDTQASLETIQEEMANKKFIDYEDESWFEILNLITLGGASMVAGYINDYAFKCDGSTGRQAALTYMNQFNIMTTGGDKYWIKNKQSSNLPFCTVNGFISATDKVESDYEKLVDTFYATKFLPSVSSEAETLFEKISGYHQIMEDNKYTIDTLAGTIRRLEQIKKEVDDINSKLASGEMDQDTYNENLKVWKGTFARLSSGLYSGDDIAKADNATKEIIDEKDHVYNDLIKSATGCEQEVKQNFPSAYSWEIYSSYRPDYTKPHLYDYPDRLASAGVPISKTTKEKSFAPNVVIMDSASTTCPTSYAIGCIDITGFVQTKDPHKAENAGYYWEQALGIY